MHLQRFDCVDASGVESVEQSVAAHMPRANDRRVRLAELDSYIHCSVIGTCVASAGLYEIVAHYAGLDLDLTSEFELHHAAVQIVAEGGQGAAALQEALDSLYDSEIRRFERARDENELLQWWHAQRRRGEAAGAYWALLTHPRVSGELRQRIVGELHGLTYLRAGSSGAPRAD